MVYKSGDKLKKLGVPWITKAGYLDLTKLPIDVILAQAVGDDGEKFRTEISGKRLDPIFSVTNRTIPNY